MGYFDVFSVPYFRNDSGGRRMFIPFGRSAYVVSSEVERRIRRMIAASHAAMFVLIVVCASTKPNWPWLLLLASAYIAGFVFLLARIAQALRPLRTVPRDLPPWTGLDLFDAFAQATGAWTLRVVAIAALFFTVACAWTAMWWGAAFFGLGTAMFVAQLWRLRLS